MKKVLKIEVKLWEKAINDEKTVYLDVGLQEFAKRLLGIDYKETEDVDSIELEIEEINLLEIEE